MLHFHNFFCRSLVIRSALNVQRKEAVDVLRFVALDYRHEMATQCQEAPKTNV